MKKVNTKSSSVVLVGGYEPKVGRIYH